MFGRLRENGTAIVRRVSSGIGIVVAALTFVASPTCAHGGAPRGQARLTIPLHIFGGRREQNPARVPRLEMPSPAPAAPAPAGLIRVTPLPIPDFNNPLKRHRMA